MNAVGIKPLPGFATLRDGYLPGNAKARSVLRITAADGLQQAVRVDVNATGNGKAKLDTLKPNGSPLGSILANGFTSNGFTGIDDPYEPPANCEITLKCDNGIYASPSAMAEKVICYLEYNGYLQA
ncbi:hypothetical protein GH714_031621 [Hevea brasiliensis]|uniref:Uncharacterized protein n=1 Tax=Hevea brasiliensis TaxID=3981 RepID=A0A6A6N9K3_HEVBR|nr:hypothetical protein GH714_031610 [Hevea brasiliensis]KAF2320889.1 hypothetical protein GH714_031621 [Hevea brasiliensis]